MTLTVGSLCTGTGQLERALTLAGLDVELAFVADPDPAASTVLAHHHPDVPNLGDITAVDWAAVTPVDIITAGFPCQDVSSAGRRAGIAPGTRSGLWLAVAEAIAALRPPLVLLENVRGLLSARAASDVEPCPWCLGDRGGDDQEPVLRALGAVLGDLSDLGYDTQWVTVAASDVGTAHRRERVFIAAWPATDTAGVGHGHVGPPPLAGIQAAPVGGGARPGGVSLLPTPNAALGRGAGTPSPKLAAQRFAEGKRFLDDAVALLPTPDATHGRKTTRTGPLLAGAVELLPTPRASDGVKGGPNQRGSSGDLMLPAAVQPGRWGRYAAAIQRWEQVTGIPAPEPTEPGKNGPRLSARFVEWLQGVPAGYVTDLVKRNDALRLLGNGVVALQGAHALRLLAGGR